MRHAGETRMMAIPSLIDPDAGHVTMRKKPTESRLNLNTADGKGSSFRNVSSATDAAWALSPGPPAHAVRRQRYSYGIERPCHGVGGVAKLRRDTIAGPSSNGRTPDFGLGPARAGPLSCSQLPVTIRLLKSV